MPIVPDSDTAHKLLRQYTRKLVSLYHSLKIPVLPLCWPDSEGRCACGRGHEGKNVGKAPLVKWGHFKKTPPTASDVRNWFTRWPDANVGIEASASNLVVVDCDSEAALDEVMQLGVPLGPRVRRDGRVKHLYFGRGELPSARVIQRGASGKIDVLSGGIIVMPPSRHRTGSRYEFGPPLTRDPLPPCPDWVREILGTSTPSSPSMGDAVTFAPSPQPVVLDRLPVPAFIRDVIVRGPAMDPLRYPSRSNAVFAVVTALVRAGSANADIAAVLLDPRFAISEKPREQGLRWVQQEVLRARVKSSLSSGGRGRRRYITVRVA